MPTGIHNPDRLPGLRDLLDRSDDPASDLFAPAALNAEFPNDGWLPELAVPLAPHTDAPPSASDDAAVASSPTSVITNGGVVENVVGPNVGDTGDQAMQAPAARTAFDVDGTGIRIGIISNSFDANGANAVAVLAEELDGDLPPTVTVLSDATGGDDEGRAMAELAHKVAPGAQIFFATEGNGAGATARAIASLEAAGCNIIVDDISWFTEPFFQDGGTMQSAVEAATATGVSYFTSAGNQFSHYYQSKVGAMTTQRITINAGGEIDIDMQWTQPFASIGAGSHGSAYSIGWELFVAGTTINPVAWSTIDVIGGNPLQQQEFNVGAGTYDLVFVQQTTVTPVATDTMKVVVFTGDWLNVTMAPGSGSGTTFGQELVSSANVVGAVDANNPGNVEFYSSDGPGQIFYNSSGTALATPLTESTPNFLAPDDITTSTDLSPFAGTSAAAPDAAAAGALLLQLNPNLTSTDVQRVLTKSASTAGLSGSAAQEGAGLINADNAATLVYDGLYVFNTTTVTNGTTITNSNTVYNGSSTDFDSVLAWNNGNGDWDSPANWVGSVAPSATSYVTLGDNLGGLTSGYAVTLDTSAGTIATLTVGDAASIATALTIAAGGSVSVAGGATVGKSGSMTIATGASLGIAGLLRLEDVAGSSAQLVVGANAHLAAAGIDITGGSVAIGAGAILTDSGALNIAESGAGTFALSGTASVAGGVTLGGGGQLSLGTGSRVSATGTLAGQSTSSVEIARSSTLSAAALSSGFVTIDTGGVLQLSTINSIVLQFLLPSTIIEVKPGGGSDNFAHLILSGFTHSASDSLVVSSGLLTIDGAGNAEIAALQFDTGSLLSRFSIVSDGSGPLEVNIACFVTGTRIATPDGEIPVERLHIGDRVLTASGASAPIRWIGRRDYTAAAVAAERKLRPIRVAAGALGERLPRRDLFVSQQHALLLPDGGAREVLVPAVQLVNGATVTRCETAGATTYFHLELATHEVIFAEGQPAETFIDRNSRDEFDNADDYALLYPSELPTIVPFCAPRIEGGAPLARIRAVVEARAGVRPGPLQGNVDRVDHCMVEGWAFDPDFPECPVLLEIVVDDVVVAVLLADQYRVDLRAMNDGNCAFYFPVPPTLPVGHVLVRRASDGCALGASRHERTSSAAVA